MSSRDVERLRQFPRPGAKTFLILNAAPFFHQLDATHRLHRTNQNETVLFPFHQDVQHPVCAITEVNISRACFVSLNKTTRAGAGKCMGGFVVLREICFRLYHGPCAFSPNELRVNEFARARERVTPVECTANELFFHVALTPSRQWGPRQTTPSKALSWVINPKRYVESDRVAVTDLGNK